MFQKKYFYEGKNPGLKIFACLIKVPNFAPGEMAERSNAAVLKTVEGHTSGGSNPSLSAEISYLR